MIAWWYGICKKYNYHNYFKDYSDKNTTIGIFNPFVGFGSCHPYSYTGVSQPTCLILWLPTIPTSSPNLPNHSQNASERCSGLVRELLFSVPVVDGVTLLLRSHIIHLWNDKENQSAKITQTQNRLSEIRTPQRESF